MNMKDIYKYNKEIKQAMHADSAFQPQNKKLQVKHLYSMAPPRKAVLCLNCIKVCETYYCVHF